MSNNTQPPASTPPKRGARRAVVVLAGIVASIAVFMANVDQIAGTVRKWRGTPEAIQRADVVLEDVSLVPDSGATSEFGRWTLTTVSVDQFRAQIGTIPNTLREFSQANLPAEEVLEKEPESCGFIVPGDYYRMDAINTLVFDEEKQAVDKRQQAPNNLNIIAYKPTWSFSPVLGPRAIELVGRPFPDPEGDRLWWCNDLSQALIHEGLIRPVVYRILLRNRTGGAATLLGFRAEPIRQYGGDAGSGGIPIIPVGPTTELRIRHDSIALARLVNPISLDAGMTTLLELRVVVEDAAQGDGPGTLLFRLVLEYFDGSKRADLFVGNFLMRDAVDELTSF